MITTSLLLRAGLMLGLISSAWAQPVIPQPPQNQATVAGKTVTFTVGATGEEPLSYQWRSHVNATTFTNIPFGTQPTLVLTNLEFTTRLFSVVVTDSGGLSATSNPPVSIVWLLAITTQPADQIVDVGARVTFIVTARAAPLVYQWRFNGANVPDQTNRSFVLPNAQSSHAGHYDVVVSNTDGSLTSRVARLALTAVHGLEGIMAHADHLISLTLAGGAARLFAPYYDLYPIDASTNLVDWSPLATLQRTNISLDALSYLDRDATAFVQRFYRTPSNHLITPIPKPSGPYPVGTVSRLMTDPSRIRNTNPTNSAFMVTFWYPGETRAGVLPGAYVEKEVALANPSHWSPRSAAAVTQFVSLAFPGLSLATNQSIYPVLLYSHGLTGFRRQNTDKAEELASHGYVVVAVEHEDAFASVFPNGQLVRGAAISGQDKAYFQPIFENRVKDFVFVVDELSRLNTNDTLLAGRLDLERLAAFGFSVGAVTVGEFCRIDPRCKAAALFDVGPFLVVPPDLNRLGLQKPFLSMNSTMLRPAIPLGYDPEWLSPSRALFTNAITNAFWFQIQNSAHQSFSDKGALINDPTQTGDPTPVSRAQSQTIRACTLSFFDKFLKNQDDHLLDNPAAVYPNVFNFRSK